MCALIQRLIQLLSFIQRRHHGVVLIAFARQLLEVAFLPIQHGLVAVFVIHRGLILLARAARQFANHLANLGVDRSHLGLGLQNFVMLRPVALTQFGKVSSRLGQGNPQILNLRMAGKFRQRDDVFWRMLGQRFLYFVVLRLGGNAALGGVSQTIGDNP